MQIPPAPGSSKSLRLRISADTGFMLVGDIKIPPRSFNLDEPLEGKTMQLSVLSGEENKFFVTVDGQDIALCPGDHTIVRSGSRYLLRNDSVHTTVLAKMVLVSQGPVESAAEEEGPAAEEAIEADALTAAEPLEGPVAHRTRRAVRAA